jgi:FkbM family methyltransferase
VTVDFPFDLASAQLSDDVRASGDAAEYVLQLAGAPWTFACLFPPSAKLETACTIEFDLNVVEGQVSIATLGPNSRYCFDEAFVLAAPKPQRVRLRCPPHVYRGSLVIRSAAKGVCRLRMRAVKVTERDPAPGETEELAALEGFLASASDLGALARPSHLLRGYARGTAGEALRSVSAAAGFALVDVDDPGCSRWLDAISEKQLVDLAAAMVVEPTSPKAPGWRFNWAQLQADPHWQLRMAVWRAMRDRCPDAEIDLPWLGGTVVRTAFGSDLSLPLFTLGQFEPNICRIVRPMLREGDTFIDIGANEGLYTLLAASAVGTTGLVVAVEPSPRELQRLRRNLSANRLEPRTIVLDQAMSAGSGWAEFAVAGDAHAGQNAFADRFDHRAGLAELRATATTTLDMLAGRLAPRHPTFIKMDVEGAEYDVLLGADWVIEEARPTWVIEIGRANNEADRRVTQRLELAGYTVFAIDDGSGEAIRPETDEAWAVVENIIAIPTERLEEDWPGGPASPDRTG